MASSQQIRMGHIEYERMQEEVPTNSNNYQEKRY